MKLTHLIAGVVLAGGLLAVPSASQALTPPPIDKAEVVFSNGGRILAAKADGTERRVVYGQKRRATNDGRGAIDPAVSSDGQTIAFNLRRGSKKLPENDVWIMKSDGSDPKRLFKSTRNRRYRDPAFAPDGRIVLSFTGINGRVVTTGLISVGPGGGDRRFLTKSSFRKKRWDGWQVPVGPAVSPDGKRVLFASATTFENGGLDDFFGARLGVLTLKTRKTRWIGRDSYPGSWSPDGKTVVFAMQIYRDGSGGDFTEVCWWERGCDMAARLVTADPEGKNRRFLTAKSFDARSPDWSADRIVFQSTRSAAGTGESNEIYSIQPDGKCLTALTNGTPASVTPVWNGTEASDHGPSSCGFTPPGPEIELTVPAPDKFRVPGFWLGTRSGDNLLSLSDRGRWYSSFYYVDCAKVAPSSCRAPAIVFTADICFVRGQLADVFAAKKAVRSQRGLPVFRFPVTEFGPEVLLATGRNITYVLGGSGKGKRQAITEIAALRRYGQDEPEATLRPPRFPASDILLMKKVERSFRATGSVPVSARRLGISRERFRQNLKLRRSIKQFGEYGTVGCPRRGGVESDSGSDRS